jgi:hypothetical protein
MSAKRVSKAAAPPVEEATPFDHTAAHALDTRSVPDEAVAELTEEQIAAGKAAVAKQEHGWFDHTASDTVMVLVGPNGAAGRIVLGGAVYDGQTPRRMARSDFERLKSMYDLVEVQTS